MLTVGLVASILIYFLQINKVEKRVWILVPICLVCSIMILKSSAGVVVDGIAVHGYLSSLCQGSLELIRYCWVQLSSLLEIPWQITLQTLVYLLLDMV
jgi:hypothetical protein